MAATMGERIMIFVDGTNLLRGISRELNIKDLRADNPSSKVLALASRYISYTISIFRGKRLIRKYWFASYKGSDETRITLSEILRYNGFEPMLFQKRKGREKGVDIALTMQMLVNAFNQNYDNGVLIAGDEDYLELVNEVKRYGPRVIGSYFKEGLSTRLRLAFDEFHLLESGLNTETLNQRIEEIKAEV
jgi:uncharacterized LabA/DUF88 family protein